MKVKGMVDLGRGLAEVEFELSNEEARRFGLASISHFSIAEDSTVTQNLPLNRRQMVAPEMRARLAEVLEEVQDDPPR